MQHIPSKKYALPFIKHCDKPMKQEDGAARLVASSSLLSILLFTSFPILFHLSWRSCSIIELFKSLKMVKEQYVFGAGRSCLKTGRSKSPIA
jgi:hypothetical protein